MHVVTSACKADLLLVQDSVENVIVNNDVTRKSTLEKKSNGKSITIENGFCPEEFVDRLLNEGCDKNCDENAKSFNEQTELPPYYNEELYKKGQKFFNKHIFGLFLSKFLGLVLLLTLHTAKLLLATNKSSTPLTAYKRYLATIFHMLTWYQEDCKPGSKLRDSIAKVKSMHNSASKLGIKKINYKINQTDMALTQFGFMGFAIIRSKMMGVHHATEEELKGFIHLWRVVGYLLGIEDKYNICRESVSETKDICNLLVERVFRPALMNPVEEFEPMSKALVKGMWVMNPFLQHDVFLCYLHMTLENSTYEDLANENIKELKPQSKSKLNIVIFILWALQYTIVRVIHKYLQIIAIWFMRNFPFLAYYKFSRENSHVTI